MCTIRNETERDASKHDRIKTKSYIKCDIWDCAVSLKHDVWYFKQEKERNHENQKI